jgi:hypothetical protein
MNELIDLVFANHPNKSACELDLHGNVGHTGYLDFVQNSDMLHPFMYGLDDYKRPFLSIKHTIEVMKCNECSELQSDCSCSTNDDCQPNCTKKNYTVVCTLFQRYSNNPTLVCIGTCYTMLGLSMFKNNVISSEADFEQTKERINRLMYGQSIKSLNDVMYDMNSLKNNQNNVSNKNVDVVGQGNMIIYIDEIRQQYFKLLCTLFYTDLASFIMTFY